MRGTLPGEKLESMQAYDFMPFPEPRLYRDDRFECDRCGGVNYLRSECEEVEGHVICKECFQCLDWDVIYG